MQGTASTGGSLDVLYGTQYGKVPDVKSQDCGYDNDKPQLALDAVALNEVVWHLPACHVHLRRGPLPLRLPCLCRRHWGNSPSWRLAVGDTVTLVILLLYSVLVVTNFSRKA